MGSLTVFKVKAAKPGRHIDGDGLCLIVKASGARSWVLRIQVDGKRRDIGLGAVDTDGTGRSAFGDEGPIASTPLMLRKSLSLTEAREKAAALRKLAKAGADPVLERDRERKKVPTFAEAVTAAHDALKSGWTDKTAKAFKASLEEHANPKLGAMKVESIRAADVILALSPIWSSKPRMAAKVRNHIGQVLAFAKSHGWRSEAMPDARELKAGLSRQTRGGNFKAMAYGEVPTFVADQLAKTQTHSRQALIFTILTAARSGEVRGATWAQIDLESRTWTRPAALMKMKEPHVVTLSEAALNLLSSVAPEDGREGLVFPGMRSGRPLSDMTLTKIMRLAGRKEAVHGFRSTFRDWAAEKMPTIPDKVAEMALAHKVGSTTEQAYLRTDMREMRQGLMEAWGRFAAASLCQLANNIVPFTAQQQG